MTDKVQSTWVDPPSGWKYGFPKLWDRQVEFEQWLIDNGYPEKDIELACNYSRYWLDDSE
jgi:hypothetical protein